MSTLRTILKLTVLAVILVWVWMLAEFQADGERLTLLRLGVAGAGLILAGTILSGREGSYKATLGVSYALVFGLVIGLTGGKSSDHHVLRTVQIDVDGLPVQHFAEVISRDQFENQTMFETLMARNAVPYDRQYAATEEFAVQTVGRSQFSPMELSGN